MNARLTPGDNAISSAEPAGLADRSCCCASKAAVRVTLPPATDRPKATDLLLCGHHYRVSRRALDGARVFVTKLPGISSDIAAWIDMTQPTALGER
jgi:hypothetical protein